MKVVIIGRNTEETVGECVTSTEYSPVLLQQFVDGLMGHASTAGESDESDLIKYNDSITRTASLAGFASIQDKLYYYPEQSVAYNIVSSAAQIPRGRLDGKVYICFDDGNLVTNVDKLSETLAASSHLGEKKARFSFGKTSSPTQSMQNSLPLIIVTADKEAFLKTDTYQQIKANEKINIKVLSWQEPVLKSAPLSDSVETPVHIETQFQRKGSIISDVGGYTSIGKHSQSVWNDEEPVSSRTSNRQSTQAKDSANNVDVLPLFLNFKEPLDERASLVKQVQHYMVGETAIELPTLAQSYKMIDNLRLLTEAGHTHARLHIAPLNEAVVGYYQQDGQNKKNAEALSEAYNKGNHYLQEKSRLVHYQLGKRIKEVEEQISALQPDKQEQYQPQLVAINKSYLFEQKKKLRSPNYNKLVIDLENLALQTNSNAHFEQFKEKIAGYLREEQKKLWLEKKRIMPSEVVQLAKIAGKLNTSNLTQYEAQVAKIEESMTLRSVLAPFLKDYPDFSLTTIIQNELYKDSAIAKSSEFLAACAFVKMFQYYQKNSNMYRDNLVSLVQDGPFRQFQQSFGDPEKILDVAAFHTEINELKKVFESAVETLRESIWPLDLAEFEKLYKTYQTTQILDNELLIQYVKVKTEETEKIRRDREIVENAIELFGGGVDRPTIANAKTEQTLFNDIKKILKKEQYVALPEVIALSEAWKSYMGDSESVKSSPSRDSMLQLQTESDLRISAVSSQSFSTSSTSEHSSDQAKTSTDSVVSYTALKASYDAAKHAIEQQPRQSFRSRMSSSFLNSKKSPESPHSITHSSSLTSIVEAIDSRELHTTLALIDGEGEDPNLNFLQERVKMMRFFEDEAQNLNGEVAKVRSKGYTVKCGLSENLVLEEGEHHDVYGYVFNVSDSPDQLKAKLDKLFLRKGNVSGDKNYVYPYCVFMGNSAAFDLAEDETREQHIEAWMSIFKEYAVVCYQSITFINHPPVVPVPEETQEAEHQDDTHNPNIVRYLVSSVLDRQMANNQPRRDMLLEEIATDLQHTMQNNGLDVVADEDGRCKAMLEFTQLKQALAFYQHKSDAKTLAVLKEAMYNGFRLTALNSKKSLFSIAVKELKASSWRKPTITIKTSLKQSSFEAYIEQKKQEKEAEKSVLEDILQELETFIVPPAVKAPHSTAMSVKNLRAVIQRYCGYDNVLSEAVQRLQSLSWKHSHLNLSGLTEIHNAYQSMKTGEKFNALYDEYLVQKTAAIVMENSGASPSVHNRKSMAQAGFLGRLSSLSISYRRPTISSELPIAQGPTEAISEPFIQDFQSAEEKQRLATLNRLTRWQMPDSDDDSDNESFSSDDSDFPSYSAGASMKSGDHSV